jgi:hypothetical protein
VVRGGAHARLPVREPDEAAQHRGGAHSNLDDAPPEAGERLAAVAALTDACCDALLDVEHRTACRRLLVDVAAADPALLQRGRADTIAAAAVWIVAKANGSLSQSPGGLTAKAVGEQLGVGSNPGQRAATMLRAIGAPKRHTYDLALGTARYLVAERRRWVREMAAAPSR